MTTISIQKQPSVTLKQTFRSHSIHKTLSRGEDLPEALACRLASAPLLLSSGSAPAPLLSFCRLASELGTRSRVAMSRRKEKAPDATEGAEGDAAEEAPGSARVC
ncbi:hypothetical protein BDA96_05G015200 [Sorghum bicolor]|uniref:Uncharacterized protein n=1 Tax=Sorghum bicolor TaxID=4558 RepID=A0A921UFD8_SORBI|nr:hypothetical protein BDA96_05G015200 [Sorghum bicolor]